MRRIRGIPTTVLVACDSFKGTLTARQVVEAIASGLEESGRPVDRCPVADGGEGTLDALAPALGLELREVWASDPLGRPVRARFGLGAAEGRSQSVDGTRRSRSIDGVRARQRVDGARGSQRVDGARGWQRAGGARWSQRADGALAVVETAAASGLHLVAGPERDALAASSAGTGELIAAATDAGARTILLGVGGSATTDGGAGAIAALKARGGLRGARLLVLCDVRTPFEDAPRVFGPQKGATPEQVRALEQRLELLAAQLPRDPRGVPMTGAAGGLSGGLWAAFGAELVPGAAFILDALGFEGRLRAARAVVTGEGRLDRQSLAGKLVAEIATRARQAGVPCHAVAGSRELDDFGARMLDLEQVLLAGDEQALRRAGARLAELL